VFSEKERRFTSGVDGTATPPPASAFLRALKRNESTTLSKTEIVTGRNIDHSGNLNSELRNLFRVFFYSPGFLLAINFLGDISSSSLESGPRLTTILLDAGIDFVLVFPVCKRGPELFKGRLSTTAEFLIGTCDSFDGPELYGFLNFLALAGGCPDVAAGGRFVETGGFTGTF